MSTPTRGRSDAELALEHSVHVLQRREASALCHLGRGQRRATQQLLGNVEPVAQKFGVHRRAELDAEVVLQR
jgi:hypothetical protein